MPSITYTAQQLLALRDSPLVRRPTTLPAISQWIEAPNQQRNGQRKADENENPAKRSSLFETRSRVSQNGNRDDIFLGPKLSFASASAARQATKNPSIRDKSPNEDTRRKGIGRERSRDRRGQTNGHVDDNRPRTRQRRESGGEKDRQTLKPRNGRINGNDVEGDGPTGKRDVANRGKFEQPWFREHKERNGDEAKEDQRGSWRDRDRQAPHANEAEDLEGRGGKSSWTNSTKAPEPQAHDMAAFLKSMKATNGRMEEEKPTSSSQSLAPDISFAQVNHTEQAPIADDVPLFGLLGDMRFENRKGGEDTGNREPEKPKVSRFFNLKSTQTEAAPVPTHDNHLESQPRPQSDHPPLRSPTNEQASQSLNEDKAGFELIMRRLREASPSQQNEHASESTIRSQVPRDAPEVKMAQSDGRQVQSNSEHTALHSPPPAPQSRIFPESSMSTSHSRTDNTENRQKLLNDLMRQSRAAGSPSVDAEIYGRSYTQQRERHAESYMLPSQNGYVPTAQKPAGPPGLSHNQHAFAANQEVDIGPMTAELRYNGPPLAKPVEHQQTIPQLRDMPFAMSPPNLRFPYNGPPMYEPRQQEPRHIRPPSQDNLGVPPGLRQARPGMPPMTLPSMPSIQHGQTGQPQKQSQHFLHQPPLHQQYHPFSPQSPPYLQQHMPQLQMPHPQARGPPPTGPPPGFMNGMGMPGMQPSGLGAHRGPDRGPQPPPLRSPDTMYPHRMQMMSPGFPSAGHMR